MSQLVWPVSGPFWGLQLARSCVHDNTARAAVNWDKRAHLPV